MHDVQFLCNLKRLNILIPVFEKHKIQIGVTGDFKYFASLFGNRGFNPSVASMVLDWINSSTITCQSCWRHES
jgi:hypothetical protein